MNEAVQLVIYFWVEVLKVIPSSPFMFLFALSIVLSIAYFIFNVARGH